MHKQEHDSVFADAARLASAGVSWATQLIARRPSGGRGRHAPLSLGHLATKDVKRFAHAALSKERS